MFRIKNIFPNRYIITKKDVALQYYKHHNVICDTY